MSEIKSKTALTAQDVADILKIAKNTVYELIKRGEINHYKVGRKVRFTQADVDDYIASFRRAVPAAPRSDEIAWSPLALPPSTRNFIICGQDLMLDVLSNYLSRHPLGRPALRAHIGSYNGLSALYRGEVQAATCHLWDGDTGEYNTPFVRRLLPGIRAVVIRLTWRTQGLYVAKGNPLGLTGWKDFLRSDVTMINRETGAGSRVLLDEHLRLLGVYGRDVRGYATEGQSHHAVASAVGRRQVDVAVGHQKAAEQVGGVEFIPLQKERYDLVVKREDMGEPVIKALLEILRLPRFKQEFESMGGYELDDMGEIVAET